MSSFLDLAGILDSLLTAVLGKKKSFGGSNHLIQANSHLYKQLSMVIITKS